MTLLRRLRCLGSVDISISCLRYQPTCPHHKAVRSPCCSKWLVLNERNHPNTLSQKVWVASGTRTPSETGRMAENRRNPVSETPSQPPPQLLQTTGANLPKQACLRYTGLRNGLVRNSPPTKSTPPMPFHSPGATPIRNTRLKKLRNLLSGTRINSGSKTAA